jgi:hypothetical protein
VIHENEQRQQQYIPAAAHTAAKSEEHAAVRSEFKAKYINPASISAESHLGGQ